MRLPPMVLRPVLPGTPPGDRFSERRVGLDHLAIGVSGRDPDNFQWEFFSEPRGYGEQNLTSG